MTAIQTHEPVAFDGRELLCAVIHDEPHVAIWHICEGIGMNADSAIRNLKKHPIYGPGHTVRLVQVPGDQGRDLVFLPLRLLFGWLAGISPDRVKPEIRDTIIRYQLECHDALFRHFYGEPRAQWAERNEEAALLHELHALASRQAAIGQRRTEIRKRMAELQTARVGHLLKRMNAPGQLTLNMGEDRL